MKMLERIRAGHYYPAGGPNNPWERPESKNLQVLLDHGLITAAGRWVLIKSYYVPIGFKSVWKETFPKFVCTHANAYTAEYGEIDRPESRYTATRCPTCNEVLEMIPYQPEPAPATLADISDDTPIVIQPSKNPFAKKLR